MTIPEPESLDETMHAMGDPADYDTPAGRLAAFADHMARTMTLAIVLGDHKAEMTDLNDVLAENRRLKAQLRMQNLGDRAEQQLAESRVHWAPEDLASPSPCGDMRGRSTRIGPAVMCPACRAWMSGDDEPERDLRAARDMLRRPETRDA